MIFFEMIHEGNSELNINIQQKIINIASLEKKYR